MRSAGDQAQLARQLHDVASELDSAVRQVRAVQERVRSTIGSSATGADKQMLGALGQVAGSARGAQQSLSAAAGSLRGLR